MPHDYQTRTIDYNEEHPPEWATREEKQDFHPKRAAKIICEELRRAEAKLAGEGKISNK